MFIGLTGGVGAGKSTALKILGELGCAVLSTDEVVHELQDEPETLGELAEHFSAGVIDESGRLDRSALARVVFADESEREWLEGLLWPKVSKRTLAWRDEVSRRAVSPRAGVIEVPLLFESGMDEGFDLTICVVAAETLRQRRAMDRGHEGLDERVKRQFSQEEKAARADFAVANDGSEEDLRGKLSELLAKIGV